MANRFKAYPPSCNSGANRQVANGVGSRTISPDPALHFHTLGYHIDESRFLNQGLNEIPVHMNMVRRQFLGDHLVPLL